MTDIVAAYAAIQARAISQITGISLLWQDEGNVLPDTPAPFVYFELVTESGGFIEIGGGRGANRHRHNAELHAYVMVPRGNGLTYGLTRAEPVAAAFRSYRGAGISCSGGTVHPVGEGESLTPPGLSSAAGNYACVMVAIPLYFDQVS